MYFLGLDYSTQKLKALVFDICGELVIEDSIDYDTDLRSYGTVHGVHKKINGAVYTPTIMWIDATDHLFNRLSLIIDLTKIISICGCAQQHTTMFWGKNTNYKLAHLDPLIPLSEQFLNMFSTSFSPSWMDSSTTKECQKLEEICGGKNELQNRIGCSLANRFSGPQIMKAFNESCNLEHSTEHITLVSNGMCSVFAGKIVGMDISDAAGTGLQKCGSLNWESDICSIISPDLEMKLGKITNSSYVAGYLNQYFVDRYKMSPHCKVVSFTGDNPSSVVGMLLKENDICISLGTSDTLFSCMTKIPESRSDIPVFVFPHPLYQSTFVSLLCYKNGSQMRQSIRNEYANGNWEIFNKYLDDTSPGNNGVLCVFYDIEEITPPGAIGRFFANCEKSSDLKLTENSVDNASLIRGLVEGQFLTKFYHFSSINTSGINLFGKLLITGGASINKSILQVAADIFNKPVWTIDTTNSAAMGSVYRAVLATQGNLFFPEFVSNVYRSNHICNPEHYKVYEAVIPHFIHFFNSILNDD